MGALPLDPATFEKVDETFGFRFVETGFYCKTARAVV